ECEPENNNPGRPAVESPASYLGVTSVGGTEIDGNYNSQGDLVSITAESVWNEPPGISTDCNGRNVSDGAASGGGVSAIVDKPDYQMNAGGFNGGVPAGTKRFVPDLSLLAGPPFTIVFIQGDAFLFSGTSQSSPLWAGLLSLINQSKKSAQGS